MNSDTCVAGRMAQTELGAEVACPDASVYWLPT